MRELEPFAHWMRERVDAMRAPSDREAARRIGVSSGQLSQYVRALARPEWKTIKKLAEFFEVPTSVITDLLDTRRPESTDSARRPSGSVRYRAIEGESELEALADPRLPVAFYGLLASWPDMSVDEQEDILSTIADGRKRAMERRQRGPTDADSPGGPTA